MTDEDRIVAIPMLMDWARQDDTVKELVKFSLIFHLQPAIGHLARFNPVAFDELFEEAEAMIENDI